MTFESVLTDHIQKFVEEEYYKLSKKPLFYWFGKRKISINFLGNVYEFVCTLHNEFVFVEWNGIRFFSVSFKDYPDFVDSRFVKHSPEAIQIINKFCNIAIKG